MSANNGGPATLAEQALRDIRGWYAEGSGMWIQCNGKADVVDALIAELAAEVARYRAALEEIVDPYSCGWAFDALIDYEAIARNALREG